MPLPSLTLVQPLTMFEIILTTTFYEFVESFLTIFQCFILIEYYKSSTKVKSLRASEFAEFNDKLVL